MTTEDLLQTAVDAAINASVDRSSDNITYRPGTVIGIDPTGATATVAMDGDESNTPVGTQILYPTGVIPGDRVMIVFVKPHAAFLVGRRGGDFDNWHFINPVGTAFFDTFNTGWQNASGTNWPNTAAESFVCYRRHGRIVELRGQAERVSGSSTLVYKIPPDYAPENSVTIAANNGLGGHCPVHVNILGEVYAPDTSSNVVFDGVMYSTNKFGGT